MVAVSRGSGSHHPRYRRRGSLTDGHFARSDTGLLPPRRRQTLSWNGAAAADTTAVSDAARVQQIDVLRNEPC